VPTNTMSKLTGLIFAGLFLAPAVGHAKPMKTFDYTNPLAFKYPTPERPDESEIRDPCIIHEGDRYYLTYTVWPFSDSSSKDPAKPDMRSSPGIALYSSADMKSWKFENWIVKSSELPDDCPYKHRFWAPEIHKIQGKFYVIFTADNWLKKEYNATGDWGYHAFVGVADKVTGPYKHITYIKDSACDTTLMDAKNGKVYAIMPFGDLFEQEIDLSRLSEGKITLGERKKILTCDNADIQQPSPKYLEGPWGFKAKGKFYLFYAETYEDSYWTGVAYADSPEGPWRKDPRGKVFEGGHLAVFDGPDGRGWFSYRGESQPEARARLCIDPFSIGPDGMIVTDKPTITPQIIESKPKIARSK